MVPVSPLTVSEFDRGALAAVEQQQVVGLGLRGWGGMPHGGGKASHRPKARAIGTRTPSQAPATRTGPTACLAKCPAGPCLTPLPHLDVPVHAAIGVRVRDDLQQAAHHGRGLYLGECALRPGGRQ
jgi:hypothetical protein